MSVLLLGGCASVHRGVDTGESSEPALRDAYRDIAGEFAGVVAQIDALNPETVSLRLVGDGNEQVFDAALERALLVVGYRVIDVAEPRSKDLDYVIRRGQGVTTYLLSVDSVQLRRAYSGPDDAPVPASELYVRGVDVSALSAPSVTPGAAPAPASELLVPAVPAAVPSERKGISLGSGAAVPRLDGVVARALDQGRLGRTRAAGSASRSPAATPPGDSAFGARRNVAELGRSNFASMLDAYGTVLERILVFPNDSLLLGSDNKALVAATIDSFEPRTDVFSLVGCSFGPTAIERGNERLAVGRAGRVKEELIALGIPSDRVVDEGCWAGEGSSRFPSRGVVLTLKRRI